MGVTVTGNDATNRAPIPTLSEPHSVGMSAGWSSCLIPWWRVTTRLSNAWVSLSWAFAAPRTEAARCGAMDSRVGFYS